MTWMQSKNDNLKEGRLSAGRALGFEPLLKRIDLDRLRRYCWSIGLQTSKVAMDLMSATIATSWVDFVALLVVNS